MATCFADLIDWAWGCSHHADRDSFVNLSEFQSVSQFCEATERVSQAKFQLAAQKSCFVRPSQECRRAKSRAFNTSEKVPSPFFEMSLSKPRGNLGEQPGGNIKFSPCVEMCGD